LIIKQAAKSGYGTLNLLENMELSKEIRAAEASHARGDSLVSSLPRAVRKRRWFLLFVALPVILATIYYGLFASDVYQSESRFVIKTASQKPPQGTSIANLIQSTGLSSGVDQTNELIDYIQSRDALRDLEKETDVKSRFSTSSADWISRYPAPFHTDHFENLYKYYTKMVGLRVDHDTNSAVLTVKAFTSKDAQDLNLRLLGLSERLVNQLNGRFQAKAVAEAEKRVGDAQIRVRDARLALREYRNSHDVMDPTAEATGVLEVTNKLITEQASLRAQLQSIERVAPRNPGIPPLRNRINAIGTQIAAQTSRAVGTDNGLASKLTQYEGLLVDQEFATQMLTMAAATLEQARTEALKQQYYLERVVEPDRPDVAMFPSRLWNILSVAGLALALYLIGWMLIVGILEHSPED
jgi:capsular polysaccharide transport system permease protein